MTEEECMFEGCDDPPIEDTQFCKIHHKQICQWVRESRENLK